MTLPAAFAGESANSSPVGLWSEFGAIPMVVTGTHDPYLVALSILVASVASYTALDLSGHVGPARGFARRMWLVAAAITMGGGIWSMHFVAMLAFIMPIPMSYDIELTTLSLVVAIFVTGGGFYVISRQSASPLRLVLSGIFMGLGIAAMHYTGMAAMRGHAELSYDPLFVALSLVVAIGASTVALWLAFRTTGLGQKLVAAVVMGLAISGMHYTAMRAAIFTTHGPVHEVQIEAQVNASLDQTNLALAVAGITFVILALASVASLSERRRSDEALRQAQTALAHVNRVTTMGQLAASISHEIKQPITAVVTNANAGLLWLAAQPPDLEEVRDAFDRVIKAGNQAGEVIDRIRDLIRKAPPRKDDLEINEAILEVIALTHGELVKNGVSLQTQLAAGLPLVQGDRVQLQQVILNLIINAVEAMSGVSEGSRELLIGTRRDALSGVVVAVQDSGPGLNPESFDRLFDPFYTTKPGGMGMGLSICRSIVEAHGGRVWASRTAGPGVTVQFTLPVGESV
jgi:NO-binding membrane sensor protein with MHYT domain